MQKKLLFHDHGFKFCLSNFKLFNHMIFLIYKWDKIIHYIFIKSKDLKVLHLNFFVIGEVLTIRVTTCRKQKKNLRVGKTTPSLEIPVSIWTLSESHHLSRWMLE